MIGVAGKNIPRQDWAVTRDVCPGRVSRGDVADTKPSRLGAKERI